MPTNRDKHVILKDFLLQRQAELWSENIIYWHGRMISPLIVKHQFTSKDIRFFLATVSQRNVSSSTVHAHARALRVFMNFPYGEEYINKPIKVPMPKLQPCEHRSGVFKLARCGSVGRRGEVLFWK